MSFMMVSLASRIGINTSLIKNPDSDFFLSSRPLKYKLITLLALFLASQTKPSCLELSGAVQSCLELPRPAWSCLELAGADWRYLELPGAVRSCAELPGAV